MSEKFKTMEEALGLKGHYDEFFFESRIEHIRETIQATDPEYIKSDDKFSEVIDKMYKAINNHALALEIEGELGAMSGFTERYMYKRGFFDGMALMKIAFLKSEGV